MRLSASRQSDQNTHCLQWYWYWYFDSLSHVLAHSSATCVTVPIATDRD